MKTPAEILRISVSEFWPYLLAWLPFAAVFGLGGLVNLLVPGGGGAGLPSILLTLAPPALMGAGGLAVDCAAGRPWLRAGLSYLTQLLLSAALIFPLFSALGGLSMAAADGGEGTARSRRRASAAAAASGLGFAHLFIIPWTLSRARRSPG
jgi:hypothetical protein